MIASNMGTEITSLFINVWIGRTWPNQIIAHGHWNSTNALGGLNLVVFACTCVYVIWNALKNSLQILTKCSYVILNALNILYKCWLSVATCLYQRSADWAVGWSKSPVCQEESSDVPVQWWYHQQTSADRAHQLPVQGKGQPCLDLIPAKVSPVSFFLSLKIDIDVMKWKRTFFYT